MNTSPSVVRENVLRSGIARFWSGRWNLSVLLALLLINVFAIPLTLTYAWGRLIARVMVMLVIVSGLIATVRDRRLVIMGAVLSIAGLLVGWESLMRPTRLYHILNDAVALPLLMVLLILVMRQVFREGPITMDRVMGAVAAYLLLGVFWAITYDLVEIALPGSFSGRSEFHQSALGILGYYSFTTLTTLGVGDVLPVRPLARSLTIFEALIGQLFPAILIARLVSMEVSYRRYGSGEE